MKQKSRFGLVVAARIHCSVHGAEQGIRLRKGRAVYTPRGGEGLAHWSNYPLPTSLPAFLVYVCMNARHAPICSKINT